MNIDRDRKVLYKLMNNVVYGKIMENLRNRIDVKLVRNKKYYLNRHLNQAICHKRYLIIIQSKYMKVKLCVYQI